MSDKADRIPLGGSFGLKSIIFAPDASLIQVSDLAFGPRHIHRPVPLTAVFAASPAPIPSHPLSLGSKLLDSLLDALHGLGVYPTGGSDDTLVGAQGPSQRKVQGSAVHIGDDPTGFGDEQGTRGVVL